MIMMNQEKLRSHISINTHLTVLKLTMHKTVDPILTL